LKVLVYGSTTFGSVVRVLVEECGHEFAGFIDDMNGSGGAVLGSFDAVSKSHPAKQFGCVNAVGYKDLAARQRVSDRIAAAGYESPSLVHPRALVGRDSHVGAGTMIMAGAIVDCRVDIGLHVVLWPGAVVAHDSVLDGNTFLSPNSTVCGCCRIAANCFVGAAAVVVDHATVPAGTRIKASQRYVSPRQ